MDQVKELSTVRILPAAQALFPRPDSKAHSNLVKHSEIFVINFAGQDTIHAILQTQDLVREPIQFVFRQPQSDSAYWFSKIFSYDSTSRMAICQMTHACDQA